jgi:hypothetical protein
MNKEQLQPRSKKITSVGLIPSCIQSIGLGKEEAPQAYFLYVEEAGDAANKVRQRMRFDVSIIYPVGCLT